MGPRNYSARKRAPVSITLEVDRPLNNFGRGGLVSCAFFLLLMKLGKTGVVFFLYSFFIGSFYFFSRQAVTRPSLVL